MQIVQCPHCPTQLSNDGSLSGQTVSCSACGGMLQMPPLTTPKRQTPPLPQENALTFDEPVESSVIRRRASRRGRQTKSTGLLFLLGGLALLIVMLVALWAAGVFTQRGAERPQEAAVNSPLKGDIKPAKADTKDESPPRPRPKDSPLPRPNSPTEEEVAADFQKRITTFQAMMRDRPEVWKDTKNQWRRSVYKVYEFRPEVKRSTQPGYHWVAELSYKEVATETVPCATEQQAREAPLTEQAKTVWEHWRVFGYKGDKWGRTARKVRIALDYQGRSWDWGDGPLATHHLLLIEDEFFADKKW
ncbi:MAG: hypothetical protein K2W96_23575 [Gemmataceae bacterium]|nr:hypothetical protein [Gemmataceae bacterium]